MGVETGNLLEARSRLSASEEQVLSREIVEYLSRSAGSCLLMSLGEPYVDALRNYEEIYGPTVFLSFSHGMNRHDIEYVTQRVWDAFPRIAQIAMKIR